MREQKPFIPRDKPKSWVVSTLAGLVGLAMGLVSFIAAWGGINWLKSVAIFLFAICWLVFAATWLLFVSGLLSGRYKNVQPKEWSKQLW
jgi:tellurite resistance protein TehA-like permease